MNSACLAFFASALLAGCGGTTAPASGSSPAPASASSPAPAADSSPCATPHAGGPVVLVMGEQGAGAIVLDAKNVYWVKGTDGSEGPGVPTPDGQILQCSKCGCDHPTVLASGERTSSLGAGIAVDATSVYWTDGNIMKVPIRGGAATTLAVAQAQGAIAVDATSVYWADGGGLMKMAIGGGTPTTLVSRSDVGAVAIDSANVYYAAGDGLFEVPLGGGAPTTLAMGSSPDTIAVDAANVYWTNFGTGHPDAPIVPVSPTGTLYRERIGHRRCARFEQPGGFG